MNVLTFARLIPSSRAMVRMRDALLMESTSLLKVSQPTSSTGLTVCESRLRGLRKPFFSLRVPYKKGQACIRCRRLLCQKRFHQGGESLALCVGAHLLVCHLPSRARYFDLG